jgi:phosphatidylglycerophosphatase C
VTRTVAAFDFDGTLTRRDTMLPFLAGLAGAARLARALASTVPLVTDRDAAKARVVERLIAGRDHAAVLDAGNSYGERVATRSVTDAMRERLTWHQDAGHEIVIVSASLDVYVGAAARSLDIDHVLCTTLAVGDDGRCTGALQGGNCRGVEKAARLRAHLGPDDVELWAYGNSGGDREMLALAQHPVWVRRGRLR